MKRQTRTFLLNAATGIAIAATAALVLLPTVASAAPAVATAFVNVRANPNPQAQVVNTLEKGEAVDVQTCETGWCLVAATGNDGWVKQEFLGNGSTQPGGSVQFGFTGPNGNTFQFGVNVPNNNPRPPVVDEPDDNLQACFFERSNYRGASFCVFAGDEIPDLAGWDGDISSIRNSDGLDVTVCTRTRYRGDCRTYTTSARSLGGFDDEISSLRVD